MLAIWSLVPLPFLEPAWTSGTSWFMYCQRLSWESRLHMCFPSPHPFTQELPHGTSSLLPCIHIHHLLTFSLLSLESHLLQWFLLKYGGLPWWLRGYSICLECRRPGFTPWVGKIPWRRTWQPLWYSCLENPMDKRAWRATWTEQTPVHGVEKSWTRVSNYRARAHTHTHTHTVILQLAPPFGCVGCFLMHRLRLLIIRKNNPFSPCWWPVLLSASCWECTLSINLTTPDAIVVICLRWSLLDLPIIKSLLSLCD